MLDYNCIPSNILLLKIEALYCLSYNLLVSGLHYKTLDLLDTFTVQFAQLFCIFTLIQYSYASLIFAKFDT